jgi:2-polyprenyl-6-methoxyphenol hydroxylase-like FAD-dependent oxidoreductase
MKRGRFDLMLLEAAIAHGVTLLQPAEVEAIMPERGSWTVHCRTATQLLELHTRWTVGAYGRSSRLDRVLGREFAGKHTGLNGIKCHLPATSLSLFTPDEIFLCAGQGLYCGINHVGMDEATLCFLEQRTTGDDPPHARIRHLTEINPGFARIVTADALHVLDNARILGSGNIFFGHRRVVEQGVFMVGDAAGVVAPLAGDGIGMALQGAVLLGRILTDERTARSTPGAAGQRYQREWDRLFRTRMRVALWLQRMLLSANGQRTASTLLRSFPSLLDVAVRWTRDEISS